jgi:hypothetical protein
VRRRAMQKENPGACLGAVPRLSRHREVARPESRECTLDRKTPNRAEPNVNDSREGRTAAMASRPRSKIRPPGRVEPGGPREDRAAHAPFFP